MVKNIILHIEKDLFFRMKEDKLRREKEIGSAMTWEDYISLLFGISKIHGNKK